MTFSICLIQTANEAWFERSWKGYVLSMVCFKTVEHAYMGMKYLNILTLAAII